MNKAKLDLLLRADRQIIWSGGGSVRHVVAGVTATRKEGGSVKTERNPLNLALVIDASGSMAGPRLEAAKKAAIGVLERLDERDRLTIVSFSNDTRVHLDGVAVTRDKREKAIQRIESLTSRSMTNLSEGWCAGADCALRIADEANGLMPRVIILSDGHANRGVTDTGALSKLAAVFRQDGITTSTLGIGDDYDESLLGAIAECGGGRMHDAELAEEIDAVLLGEIGEAADAVCERAGLSLFCPQGLEVMRLGGMSLSLQDDGTEWTGLGGLTSGVERRVVFRVRFPEGQDGDELCLTVRAGAVDAKSGKPVESDAAQLLFIQGAGAENRRQVRNEEVAAIVVTNWRSYIVLGVAATKQESGVAAARDFLGQELKHFEQYVREIPGGAEMIAELRLVDRTLDDDWSPRARKEMYLQSSLDIAGRADHRGPGKEKWTRQIDRTRRRRRGL